MSEGIQAIAATHTPTPLETERLLVRRFRPSDAEDLYVYLRLPELYRFEPPAFITR
jgi:RimJ/RimL family protein N-acetyltransferase